MRFSAVFSVLVGLAILCSGCTQPAGAPHVLVSPERTWSTPAPTPPGLVTTPMDMASTTAVTRELTPTPTASPTMTLTRKPTVTLLNTPGSAAFPCSGDNCGTLSVRLTCNPKTIFKRMAILTVKDPHDTVGLAAAVAAMGNNFVEVLPDGSVLPITIRPGQYTLVLLDANNVQVPERGLIKSVRVVTVSKGELKKSVFTEDC